MNETNQALKVALAAAEQLPPKLRRQLAERLLASEPTETGTVVLRLERLSHGKQERLGQLMDKNNDGHLNSAERAELRRLGTEADQLLLANSQALARALRPELFDRRGQPLKKRFQRL